MGMSGTLFEAAEKSEDKYMLLLASRSPRRSELLRNAGISFVAVPADIDETPREGEAAGAYALRIAEEKAMAIPAGPDDTVLGADTVVTVDGLILGKPADGADAERMLRLLSGRAHEVITGICVRTPRDVIRDSAVTKVWFTELCAAEIHAYAASGEPMDKAGAYAIQGLGSKFIRRIDGSYSNVVGLPVCLIYRHLR
jgi:septum formation protein